MRFPASFSDEEKVGDLQCQLEEAIGDSLLSTHKSRHRLPRKLMDLHDMLE